jgi:hypothetical protein
MLPTHSCRCCHVARLPVSLWPCCPPACATARSLHRCPPASVAATWTAAWSCRRPPLRGGGASHPLVGGGAAEHPLAVCTPPSCTPSSPPIGDELDHRCPQAAPTTAPGDLVTHTDPAPRSTCPSGEQDPLPLTLAGFFGLCINEIG